MDTKKCFKCNKIKSIDNFYVHSQMKDGHLNKCKECAKKDGKKHRKDNPEKLKAYDKKRSTLPHRKECAKKYAKKQNKKNPQKKRARGMVSDAIRRGKLKKQPCEKCGATIRIHGHHEDYYKPLEIIWLCSKCHYELHRSLNIWTKDWIGVR